MTCQATTNDPQKDSRDTLKNGSSIRNTVNVRRNDNCLKEEEFDIKAKVIKNDKSTTKLAVQNLSNKHWFIPYVIEPSAGVDRGVLALLNEAYKEDDQNKLNGSKKDY